MKTHTVGAYEAKTRLAQLLDRVAKGERITITRHGAPRAVLAPAGGASKRATAEVLQELRQFRQKHRLGRVALHQLIEEGRRY
ncbi:type II toxin-antitoxin system Phd/YefM family antitoxin [Nitrospira sp. Kam-Ns4a]